MTTTRSRTQRLTWPSRSIANERTRITAKGQAGDQSSGTQSQVPFTCDSQRDRAVEQKTHSEIEAIEERALEGEELDLTVDNQQGVTALGGVQVLMIDAETLRLVEGTDTCSMAFGIRWPLTHCASTLSRVSLQLAVLDEALDYLDIAGHRSVLHGLADSCGTELTRIVSQHPLR